MDRLQYWWRNISKREIEISEEQKEEKREKNRIFSHFIEEKRQCKRTEVLSEPEKEGILKIKGPRRGDEVRHGQTF